MINSVLFDLDGTLTDPALGITNSVKYALNKFGITVSDTKSLYPFIGPPLVDSFMEYYGFTKENAEKALAYYREYFSCGGMFENVVYDGIEELLKALSSKGVKLFVATSKPQEFSEKILEHFNLKSYFEKVIGATMDEKRNKKNEIIKFALQTNDIEACTAVMVGDRKFDIEGGKENGLKTIGVTYGYGGREELEKASADYIAKSVNELKKILLEI